MNATCPRCNAPIEPNSAFCTNCGAVLAASNPYQQAGSQPSSPDQPPGQQSQVPPWAASGNAGFGTYQQSQQAGGVGGTQIDPTAGGSLGFGGGGDATAKKIITVAVAIIAITIVLLLFFGLLALLIPGLRCLFLLFIVLLFVIPWFIYSYIRNLIRRSVGGMGRFF
ncbi:MAG TPA: zinc ribbon domain-containing protein [Ktedonobacteraceae bacterium]|nr:zinc ribbon domain-containing protein [Ktedonobacteraceae bacterium]